MRKILSQEEIDKSKKRNMFVLSIVILGVLVLGTVGFAFLDRGDTDTNTPEDSGKPYSIIPNGNSWSITYNGQVYQTSFSPEEVKNISTAIQMSLSDISSKPLFIASSNDAITSEIASSLQRYSSRVQKACYGNCTEDLPEKDCSSNLIVWSDSPNNRVYQSENCIFIEGDLRSADALIFKIIQIPKQ